MLKGKIIVEKDWSRKAYFEGRNEPIVSTANVDLQKVGVPMKVELPRTFELVTAALGS